jgi:two-component system sensor histidine kinase YesM
LLIWYGRVNMCRIRVSKITRSYRNLSIGRKLKLLYFSVIALPLIMLSVFFSASLSRTVEASMIASYNAGLEQLANNLSSQLGKYSQAFGELAYNDTLTTFITDSHTSDYDTYQQYVKTIQPMIKLSLAGDKSASVRIYSENLSLGISGVFIDDPEKSGFPLTPEQAYAGDETLCWPGVAGNANDREMCIYGTIRNYYKFPKRPLGILFIYFSEKSIYSLISEASAASGMAYVVNGNDIVLSSTDRPAVGLALLDSIGRKASDLATGQTFELKGGQYLTLVCPYSDKDLSISDWRLVQLVPMQPISEKRAGIWWTSGILGMLIIALSFTVVTLFSRDMNRRIGLLMSSMKSVSRGDTTIRLNSESSDEIGSLYESFNVMTSDLNRLMNEVYLAEMRAKDAEIRFHKTELEKKRAELLALQNQINPHYLFNTLESIRMNALLQGDGATARIVRVFGDSFRNLIYDTESYVSVRQELKNIQGFIEIQKYRHGDNIRFILNMDKAAADIRIPKLLLQPLVENAVFHGAEMMTRGGIVRVGVKTEQVRLVISVEDNGAGMDVSTLAALMRSIKTQGQGTENYALRNIYSRLEMIYGGEFSFDIQSRAGKGTKVIIALPLDFKAGD